MSPMHFPVAVAALMAVLTADARALASTQGCQVTVPPDEADPVWQEAVRDLRTKLGRTAPGDVDCGGIEVRADGPERLIVFTTRDGRRAERRVTAAGSLLAVVEALQITLPEPASQQTDSSAPESAKPATADRPLVAAGTDASAELAKAHFLINGSGGVRLAGAGAYTFGSSTFGIGAGANVGRWEFGVLGQLDPAQAKWIGPAVSGINMLTYAIGVRVARRDRIGPLVGVAGVSAAIGVTDETQSVGSGADVNSNGGQASLSEKIEPRLGLFAGIVVPRNARVRLRPELGFDVVVTRINQPYSQVDQSLPAPWWSTSASLGVEWEAP
jgi:hypothetical protein